MKLILLLLLSNVALTSCRKSKGSSEGWEVPSENKVVVATSLDGKSVTQEVEPNGDLATAQKLSEAVSGAISDVTDEDWFAISASHPLKIHLYNTADLVLQALDSEGHVLAKSDRGGSGVEEYLTGVKGVSYIVVSHYKTKKKVKASTYQLVWHEVSAKPEAWDYEPNDKKELAAPLAVGVLKQGTIGWNKDTDWYVVTREVVDSSFRYHLEVLNQGRGKWSISVHDETGVLLKRTKKKAGTLSVTNLSPSADWKSLYLAVYADRSSDGTPYSVSLMESTAGPDFESEPNDTAERAQSLASGQKALGTVDEADADVYVVNSAGGTVAATISNGQLQYSLDGVTWSATPTAGAKIYMRVVSSKVANYELSVFVVEPDALPASPPTQPASDLAVEP